MALVKLLCLLSLFAIPRIFLLRYPITKTLQRAPSILSSSIFAITLIAITLIVSISFLATFALCFERQSRQRSLLGSAGFTLLQDVWASQLVVMPNKKRAPKSVYLSSIFPLTVANGCSALQMGTLRTRRCGWLLKTVPYLLPLWEALCLALPQVCHSALPMPQSPPQVSWQRAASSTGPVKAFHAMNPKPVLLRWMLIMSLTGSWTLSHSSSTGAPAICPSPIAGPGL